jgi:large conductance mechanosensitive channel
LGKFALTLHPEKTRLIEFGRHAADSRKRRGLGKPIIGAVTGGLDFSNYFLPLSSKVTADTLVEAKKQGAVLAWGNFLTIAINFVIIVFVLFMAIKTLSRLYTLEAEKPKPPAPEVALLTEIRDLLKK